MIVFLASSNYTSEITQSHVFQNAKYLQFTCYNKGYRGDTFQELIKKISYDSYYIANKTSTKLRFTKRFTDCF